MIAARRLLRGGGKGGTNCGDSSDRPSAVGLRSLRVRQNMAGAGQDAPFDSSAGVAYARASLEVSHRMAVRPVNLDALITREDFEVAVSDPRTVQPIEEGPKLKIMELEQGSFMFKQLKKPDFQRTTAHWSPAKIAGFVKSFVSGDLIPAVILWQSRLSGDIFVIDGAHRLSALIAWVHDDYGDRKISIPFFGDISKEQKSV